MKTETKRSRFCGNPGYREYVELLRQLHFQMRDGLGDSPEADSIRDRMDIPWTQLDEGEIRRVDAMSADLYALEPDSPIVHPAALTIAPSEFRTRLERHWFAEEWEELLRGLREQPQDIDAGEAAQIRGKCWEALGDDETAELFYAQAAAAHRVYALQRARDLLHAGRTEDALSMLQRIGSAMNDLTDDDLARLTQPWSCLPPLELRRLMGLANDLARGRPHAPHVGPNPSAAVFREAYLREDWDAALEEVRRNADLLDPAETAFVRGACWAQLQCPDVAIRFFHEAERLGTLGELQEVWLLTCLELTADFDEALSRAECIRAGNGGPLALLKAAEVFALASERVGAAKADELRRASIELAERALNAPANDEETQQIVEALLPGVLLHLALNYEALGDRERARQACAESLRHDPNDDNAREVQLLLGASSPSSLANEERGPQVRPADGRESPSSPASLPNEVRSKHRPPASLSTLPLAA